MGKCGTIFRYRISQSPNKIVDDVVSMPGTTWFDGAKLNYAQHCLKNRSDEIAIYETNESGEISVVSWNELYNKVSQWVQFFEKNAKRRSCCRNLAK